MHLRVRFLRKNLNLFVSCSLVPLTDSDRIYKRHSGVRADREDAPRQHRRAHQRQFREPRDRLQGL